MSVLTRSVVTAVVVALLVPLVALAGDGGKNHGFVTAKQPGCSSPPTTQGTCSASASTRRGSCARSRSPAWRPASR